MDLHRFLSVISVEVQPYARLQTKILAVATVVLQTLLILFLCGAAVAAGACVGIRWVL
jgi:hypothetical protein